MSGLKHISFVIPTYRHAGSITSLCQSIIELCEGLTNYTFEILFINDGSNDDTENILTRCREKDERVKYVNLLRNFGQVAAIEAGLDFATGDAIIVLSSDQQEPVALIREMIKKWEEGNMIVLAHRKKRSDSRLDKFFSKVFYNFIQLSNPNMPIGGFDFCLFDKEVHDHMKNIRYRNRFLQGDLLYFGYKIALIPYERISAPEGRSLRNLSFKIKYFVDGILNTTAFPIRFMSILGLVITMAGFFYSFLIIINWLLGNTPFKGWAPIMMAILIVGGLILMVLGVLGEYIWRIYDELKQMPRYVIKDKKLD